MKFILGLRILSLAMPVQPQAQAIREVVRCKRTTEKLYHHYLLLYFKKYCCCYYNNADIDNSDGLLITAVTAARIVTIVMIRILS